MVPAGVPANQANPFGLELLAWTGPVDPLASMLAWSRTWKVVSMLPVSPKLLTMWMCQAATWATPKQRESGPPFPPPLPQAATSKARTDAAARRPGRSKIEADMDPQMEW